MANVDRLRAVVNRARRVDTANIAPLVDRLDVKLYRRLLTDLHPQRHAVRVEALQRAINPAEAGLTFQLWT